MKIPNLVAITLVTVLSVSWVSILFYPSVHDFMPANPFWNGIRDFSGRFQAEMVTGPDRVKPKAGGSVLIEIPYLPYQAKDLESIVLFVRNGGTLLLMDDYGYGNQVLNALGLEMEFDGRPLLDPFMCYRNQWLPLAVDLPPNLPDAETRTLILNHATALHVGGPYEVLASSADSAFIDHDGNSSWDEGEPRGPFVVAAKATLGKGTVIAVSDPSLLINSMVGKGDNGAFMKELISVAGESPAIAIDTSHLTKAPLDRSRYAWQMVRERMSTPYSQVILVGAILALTLMPLWRGGTKVDQ